MWLLSLIACLAWSDSPKAAGFSLGTTLRRLVPVKKEGREAPPASIDSPSNKREALIPSRLAFLQNKAFDPRRSYMDALLLAQGNPHKLARIMESIENHDILPPQHVSLWKKFKLRPTFCSNEDINRLYESLLTKEILLSGDFTKKMKPSFHAIFKGLSTLPHKERQWFDRSLAIWAEDTMPDKHFGVSASQQDQRLAQVDHPAQAIDFLIFQAKKLDNIGLPESITQFRNTLYKEVIERRRGFRSNAETEIKNNQWGILRQDLPSLSASSKAPWTHWGKDKCQLYEGKTPYLKAARQKDIPIVCGISGTTHMIIWSILASKVKLKPQDWRLLLLSIWGVLGADGGHSLQEILSAAKLNADISLRLGKISKDWDENWTHALESLAEATKHISAEGIQPKKATHAEHFGRYFEDFFSHIQEPAFMDIRTRARQALLKIIQESSNCEVLDPRLKETQS